MVYTRFKCDRIWAHGPKYLVQEYAFMCAINAAVVISFWKYFGWASEETERRVSYWTGYPYWRDPIARRNEDKYKRLIRDNDIDICDPKWTGVAKSAL